MGDQDAAKVIWSKQALNQKQRISDYFEYYAPSYCLKLMTAVHEAINKMARHPYAYPPDGRKRNNNGTYSFLVAYSYRVSFRIVGNTCRIVGIRHVKQDAKMY